MALPGIAWAQRIEGLPIHTGDTVEAVQAAYRTDEVPQPSQSSRKNATALHLSSHGVWVFFDQDHKAYTIRLEAPFVQAQGYAPAKFIFNISIVP